MRTRFAQFGESLRAQPPAVVWVVFSIAAILLCTLLPPDSAWCARLLPPAWQTLLLGGILPTLAASRQESPIAGAAAAWVLWNLLLLAGLLAVVIAAWGSGGLPLTLMAALCVVLVFLVVRRAVRPVAGVAVFAASFLPYAFFFPASALPAMDGSHAEGRRLFAAQGCVLCHRSTGSQSLMGLPNRLEELLSPNNRAIASPREWIYLHLYIPEAFASRERGRTCPAYPSLFEYRQAVPGVRTPWALPVETPEGQELVPAAEARHLADYLLSLRTPSMSPASGEALIARGETLFRAKCAVCHGRDAQGDALNYPPLDDPQWLHLPKEELLSIIMNGKKGKIIVHGREWDGVMLPPGVANEHDAEAIRRYLIERFAPTR